MAAAALAEHFPHGAFVRLESREVKRKYVHADADWKGISLHPNFQVPALNAVWRVQHWMDPVDGVTYVALQNAAYGRYLSFSMKHAQQGHHGYRVTQMDRDEPVPEPSDDDDDDDDDGDEDDDEDDDDGDEDDEAEAAAKAAAAAAAAKAEAAAAPAEDADLSRYPWMWLVERRPEPDQDYVSLRHLIFYLRANNGKVVIWNTGNIGVTADTVDDHDPLNDNAPIVDTVMHWRVHRVASSPVQRALPLTHDDEESVLFVQNHPARTIRHVLASAEGKFDQNHHKWPSFAFRGSSVISLKNELRRLQDWKASESAYTLCMRPGSHGRLKPLVTYALPSSLESMNIVVFKTPLPADLELRYPAPPARVAMVMD